MRWLFLAILLASLPVITWYARGNPSHRNRLVFLVGVLFFVTGPIALDAAVITWPSWPGTSRGILLSFIDAIALALIQTRKRIRHPTVFLTAIVVFAIPVAVGAALAEVKMASMFSAFQLLQVVLLFLALSGELRRPEAITQLLAGLSVGLTIQAGFVLYQKMSGVVQATGALFHQNVLGLMVQLSVPLLLAYTLEGGKGKLIYLGIASGAICVASGGSRASLAFFAASVGLTIAVSLFRRTTSRKWAIVGLVAVATALFIPIAAGTLEDRFGNLEITTKTDESRIAFERAAIAISNDHPFGVGPNNFVSKNNTGGYAARAGIEWGGGLLDKPVHNAYLLARSETGWLGQFSLIFLIIVVGFIAYATSRQRRKIPIIGVVVGSAAGVTTVALHSNYEYAWYVLEVQRLFFMNVALIAACRSMARQMPRDGGKATSARQNSNLRLPDDMQPVSTGG